MADGFQGLVLIDTSKRRAGHIGKGGGGGNEIEPITWYSAHIHPLALLQRTYKTHHPAGLCVCSYVMGEEDQKKSWYTAGK